MRSLPHSHDAFRGCKASPDVRFTEYPGDPDQVLQRTDDCNNAICASANKATDRSECITKLLQNPAHHSDEQEATERTALHNAAREPSERGHDKIPDHDQGARGAESTHELDRPLAEPTLRHRHEDNFMVDAREGRGELEDNRGGQGVQSIAQTIHLHPRVQVKEILGEMTAPHEPALLITSIAHHML